MSRYSIHSFLLLGMLALIAAQNCSTEIFVNHRKGLTGNLDRNFTDDHKEAGLSIECIQNNIQVEEK